MDYKALCVQALNEIRDWSISDSTINLEKRVELLLIINKYLDQMYREKKINEQLKFQETVQKIFNKDSWKRS